MILKGQCPLYLIIIGGMFLKIQKWANAINIQFTKIYNCWDSAWFLVFFPFLFRVFSEFSTHWEIYYSYIAKKKKNLKIGTRRKNINLSFFSGNLSFLLQDCKAPLPAPNSESQNEQICKLTNNVLCWAEKFTFFISLNPPKISRRLLLLRILQTRSSEKFSKLPKVTQQWAIELELDPRLVWPQTQLSSGPTSGPLVWDAEGWVLILALSPNQSPLHTVSSLSGPQFPHLYKEKWISQDGISSSFLLRHVWFLFS